MTIVPFRTTMKTIAAGTFKATCLAVMDEVQSKREPVLITKNGKPVAQLVPINEKQDDIFGFYSGKGKILGDIISPLVPLKDWSSLQ